MKVEVLLLAALLAIAPISEVRGAIPLVVALSNSHWDLALGVIVSTLSNMAVPVVGYKLLDLLDRAVKSRLAPGFVKSAYSWLLSLGRRRAGKLGKASYTALAVFVAVPLPATGAWTGTLIAFVLGMDRKKAITAIAAGVAGASLLVFAASYAGLELLKRLFLL